MYFPLIYFQQLQVFKLCHAHAVYLFLRSTPQQINSRVLAQRNVSTLVRQPTFSSFFALIVKVYFSCAVFVWDEWQQLNINWILFSQGLLDVCQLEMVTCKSLILNALFSHFLIELLIFCGFASLLSNNNIVVIFLNRLSFVNLILQSTVWCK